MTKRPADATTESEPKRSKKEEVAPTIISALDGILAAKICVFHDRNPDVPQDDPVLQSFAIEVPSVVKSDLTPEKKIEALFHPVKRIATIGELTDSEVNDVEGFQMDEPEVQEVDEEPQQGLYKLTKESIDSGLKQLQWLFNYRDHPTNPTHLKQLVQELLKHSVNNTVYAYFFQCMLPSDEEDDSAVAKTKAWMLPEVTFPSSDTTHIIGLVALTTKNQFVGAHAGLTFLEPIDEFEDIGDEEGEELEEAAE